MRQRYNALCHREDWVFSKRAETFLQGIVNTMLWRNAYTNTEPFSFFTKDRFVVLKQGLDGDTLLLNISEFSLNVHWTHDGRCKHDRKVERSHLEPSQSGVTEDEAELLTKLSLACWITRDRWNTKNCKVSR
jgi:hypothetical protein